MLKLGYKLMSEEHGPTDLVKNAQLPEKAGFDFAAISVHFFRRLDEQGQFCIGVVRAGSDRAGNRSPGPHDGRDLPDHALSSRNCGASRGHVGIAQQRPLSSYDVA
jgi:hypothetical protein